VRNIRKHKSQLNSLHTGRGTLAEKLLTARFYNAGFSRKLLHEVFYCDHKTMKNWGDTATRTWRVSRKVAKAAPRT